MRTLRQQRQVARRTTGRNSLSSAGQLEGELSSVRRQLSVLRNDYLELGLETSRLAGARDRALSALKLTERFVESAYSDRNIADDTQTQGRHARRPLSRQSALQPSREGEQRSGI